jgi:hypothetical protein
MVKAREAAGGVREIDTLIAEIRKTDPAFADQVQRYYDAVEDPQFLEDAMADLWEQARLHDRTVADELEHILGGPDPQLNRFRNTPKLSREDAIEEFRRAVADARVLVDLRNAHDYHGSHTHAFHQYLGDRLFGAGEGLRFRLRIAALTGPGLTIRPGGANSYVKPFWSRVWDQLFDAEGHSLHSPEILGKILQHALDFPRWDAY